MNMKQRVMVKGNMSDRKKVTSGVPQSYILSPLHFVPLFRPVILEDFWKGARGHHRSEVGG